MPISDTIPRVALVTGAARRIGRAIVEELARQGFAVAIHCNTSSAEADLLAAEIRAAGGNAAVFAADLGREDEVATLLPRVMGELGPVGVLVNNASTFERDEAMTATRASWDLHMEVNLRAPFVLSQVFAALLPPDAHGVIINLLDQRVWNLTPHFTTYTISKVGLWTLTQTLALALAPSIRVVGIGPGPALPSTRQSSDQFAAQVGRTPLGRSGSPTEIASAVTFALTSPSFTGQMIALDGGQHLDWAPGGTGLDE
jgi:NAD(P)-dependent dehydrogenase (short-subunit alcohol dehydrogenase family)